MIIIFVTGCHNNKSGLVVSAHFHDQNTECEGEADEGEVPLGAEPPQQRRHLDDVGVCGLWTRTLCCSEAFFLLFFDGPAEQREKKGEEEGKS